MSTNLCSILFSCSTSDTFIHKYHSQYYTTVNEEVLECTGYSRQVNQIKGTSILELDTSGSEGRPSVLLGCLRTNDEWPKALRNHSPGLKALKEIVFAASWSVRHVPQPLKYDICSRLSLVLRSDVNK